jgi:uncharacterized sulfatase
LKSILASALATSFFLLALSALMADELAEKPSQRPNILWIMLEDWGPELSCYGTKAVDTPNIDKLAAEGVRYTRAFTTAPVCSSSRSAMLTGHYQNYTGTNQHRTSDKKPLPYGIKPIPTLLSEAGYFTACGCGLSNKVDKNFSNPTGFEGKHWRDRTNGQPFFAQATEATTHRKWNRDPDNPIDEKTVELPPYYPDVPMVRRDWANGLEQLQLADRTIGKLLEQLDNDGLRDNTLVILIGDNGRCMPRGKQFLYDGGIAVPLIMRWPGKIAAGSVCDDLVTTLDICQTIVDVAGVTPPHPLHGLNLFEPAISERPYIFAARDKMDDTHDAMRAVRSKRYKYILNLMPERPYCQFNAYKELRYPTLAVLNVMNLEGRLTPEQAHFMAASKPTEELYDLESDPWETKNLIDDPAQQSVAEKMRAALAEWQAEMNDEGVTPDFQAGGWPADYPTRPLATWRQIVEKFRPYVFRTPGAKVKPPEDFIGATALPARER